MSWDSYLDNLIAQSSNHIDKACIISLDGGSSWTSATHANALPVTPEESASVARAFKSKDFNSFMGNGVTLGGVKYQFLREEDNRICYFRRKDEGGITMQVTKQAIVIGHCAEGKQQGNANKGVNVVAEYLHDLGY